MAEIQEALRHAERGEWKLEDLLFNPVPHVYQHMPTGKDLRSVTTLMRENGIGFTGYAPQSALDRGNYVHEASVLVDADDLDWDQVPEEYAGYVRGYEKAMRETESRPAVSEFRMFEPNLWFAGTLDRIVIRKGRRIGIELKTGSTTDVSVQAAGYDHLWSFWFPEKPIEAWECLKVNDDGTYKLFELDVQGAWRDFVSCLCLSARRARPASQRI